MSAHYSVPLSRHGKCDSDVETEPLRGEETEPREVFLLLV